MSKLSQAANVQNRDLVQRLIEQNEQLREDLHLAAELMKTPTGGEVRVVEKVIEKEVHVVAMPTAPTIEGRVRFESITPVDDEGNQVESWSDAILRSNAAGRHVRYGTVVRALWTQTYGTKREVAVKVVSQEGLPGHRLVVEWYRKIELLERLVKSQPKHVVAVYGYGMDTLPKDAGAHFASQPFGQSCFLCMEWMDGGSVRDWMTNITPVTGQNGWKLLWALTWCLHVALGLQECHESCVLHGDVKASNVMLTAPDERGLRTAKLDVGGARILGQTMKHNQSQVAVREQSQDATLEWMAPEVLARPSEMPVTFESDVYAWAITAWELLTSLRPYSAFDEFAVRQAVCEGLRPDLSRIRRDLTGPPRDMMLALLEKAWATDPKSRPAIAEVVQAMKDIIAASSA